LVVNRKKLRATARSSSVSVTVRAERPPPAPAGSCRARPTPARNLVSALQILLCFLSTTFDSGKISQSELDLNRLNVTKRIDCSFNVNDVLILKATHHLDHRIGFSDVGQKLIPETFTLGRAANEPAMSRNSTVAGTIFSVLTSRASGSNRSSGTETTPTFGSNRREGIIRRERRRLRCQRVE
jgi:hypothetical protein